MQKRYFARRRHFSKGAPRGFFSLKGVFTAHSLAVMGMLIVAAVLLGQFSIYLTPTFKAVTVAYLPGAVVGMVYGPWAAILFGVACDTVNFIARPAGPYFAGYAISEAVSYFFYALMLYRRPPKVWRIAVARLLILVTVVFGLNFVWNVMMYGSVASKYFTTARIFNNLIQLPLHVALITFVLGFVDKYRLRFGLPGRN